MRGLRRRPALSHPPPTTHAQHTQEPGRDRLVQWCHGAPGPLLLFARAYEAWGDPRYLAWAEDAADVVWARGLLRKGNGLCHGVSGNAYCAFMCVDVCFMLCGEQRVNGWCDDV